MSTYSKSIQGDSTIIQTHPATLNLPQKGKTQGIRDCLQKIHVYTQLLHEKTACTCDCKGKNHVQEEKEIKKEGKQTS